MADEAVGSEPVDNEPIDMEAMLARWQDEVAIEEQLRALGGEGDGHEWVSLAEAEDRAGVSRSTLRAWYRTGQIPSRLTPGPHGMHRLVPLDTVIERAARSPRPAAGTATAAAAEPPAESPKEKGAPVLPAHTSDVIRLAELAVQEARERAAAAERRAEAAEQALRDAIERAATAEALLRERRGGQP